jgi:hypothetical protein
LSAPSLTAFKQAVYDCVGELRREQQRAVEILLAQQREIIQRLDAQDARHEAERATWSTERARLLRDLRMVSEAYIRSNAGRDTLLAAIGRLNINADFELREQIRQLCESRVAAGN